MSIMIYILAWQSVYRISLFIHWLKLSIDKKNVMISAQGILWRVHRKHTFCVMFIIQKSVQI